MVFYVLSLNTLYVYNGIITQFCKFNLKKIFNLGSEALEQSALRKLLKAKSAILVPTFVIFMKDISNNL